jgi:hypothetical protein
MENPLGLSVVPQQITLVAKQFAHSAPRGIRISRIIGETVELTSRHRRREAGTRRTGQNRHPKLKAAPKP